MILIHGFPYYWGVERDAVDRSLVTRSTLHEVLPPYRLSTWAFRIRVSHHHWLHFGCFRYDDAVGRYGLDADVDEIREWRGPRTNGESVGAQPIEQGEEADAEPDGPVASGPGLPDPGDECRERP